METPGGMVAPEPAIPELPASRARRRGLCALRPHLPEIVPDAARETVHADEKTGEPEVFLEPLLWGLFSLGGFITAFLFPITVFLLFVAPVFGLWPTDPAAYATFAAHWQEPLVRIFFFALIGGSLFHGTHRLKFMLVDAGLRGPGIEAALHIP